MSKKSYLGQKKNKKFQLKKTHLGQKKLSRLKKPIQIKKTTWQAKKMDFISQKESNIDKENNFMIEISEKK